MELRNSIFETFDDFAFGETQIITHKNGLKGAMVPVHLIEELNEEIALHKNLANGYAQALLSERISSLELKEKFKSKEKALKAKYG